MSEEQLALARRVVACPGWRWAPGVLTLAHLHALTAATPQARRGMMKLCLEEKADAEDGLCRLTPGARRPRPTAG